MQPRYSAFTTQFTGRARELINQIGISIPFLPKKDEDKTNHPDIKSVNALWDTGATNSGITLKSANLLNLKPVGVATVKHADGESLQNVYIINIYLPNKIIISNVRVTEVQCVAGNFDVIIGMDIMGLGDLAITNYNNITTFSFIFPSIGKIDFNQNIDRMNKSLRVGRNDKCPCGSGKKYKNCCGK